MTRIRHANSGLPTPVGAVGTYEIADGWTLTHYARPWTTNGERRLHFHQRAWLVREWREAFKMLAKEAHIPPLAWGVITARPHYKAKRGSDVGGVLPAVKAAVDGLVDARVLPDDSPEYLHALTFLVPVLGAPRDALVLTIEGAVA